MGPNNKHEWETWPWDAWLEIWGHGEWVPAVTHQESGQRRLRPTTSLFLGLCAAVALFLGRVEEWRCASLYMLGGFLVLWEIN